MLITAVETELSFTPRKASDEGSTGLYTCIGSVKSGKYSIDTFWQQVSSGCLRWLSDLWWKVLSYAWKRLFHMGWLQGLLQKDVSLSWLYFWVQVKLISAISACLHATCLSAGPAGSIPMGFTGSVSPSNTGREEELTSAQSIFRACSHWLAKHCVATLQTLRLILLMHPPSHPECFTTDECLPVSLLFGWPRQSTWKGLGFQKGLNICTQAYALSWLSEAGTRKITHRFWGKAILMGVGQSCMAARTSETKTKEEAVPQIQPRHPSNIL